MADLVSSIGIGDLVEKLRSGEYLVPRFQREFVWTTADITALLNSIIESRPIGMMTLWEQPDNSGLDLEHISLPDDEAENGHVIHFGDNSHRTKKATRYWMAVNGQPLSPSPLAASREIQRSGREGVFS